jgi:hypothetical protein
MKPLGILCLVSAFGIVNQQQPARLPRPACFSPNSGRIAYSRFDTASDGDVSGQEFAFAVQNRRLVGWYRQAAGEMGLARPLDSLEVGPAGDSLFIVVSKSDYSNAYRFRVTCRSLRGTAQLFRTAKSQGQVMPLMLRRARAVARP